MIVTMKKDGREIEVDPSMVDAHIQVGWTVIETPAPPVNVSQSPLERLKAANRARKTE